MRLLTHNTLQSPLTSSYPLKITCTALRHIPSTPLTTDEGPYDFVRNLLENGKIEWDGVTGAREDLKDKIEELAVGDLQLPSSQPSPDSPDYTSTLKTLHILLLEVHVLEGTLIDKENGRAFKIDNGIPNMILLEDEIER
ncbi:hypothetical protein TrVE_jg979 [Triparma verrucosa]|uniref:Multifunctional methyltransferase subunit TRM112-like protein n=2 Tax=Triparma TaxID=722752 RepID=A0A9W7BNY2_9STRA|nr:hypothetical protein TrST_g2640 [Triparma strigata]GMI16033.1 hypothetical protein TrVE_jg979 [Triparma verrucosa]|mmetsp:Transcript_13140/g.24103  ORF Transcript_13140/g.24103 Transcript_13140/m.24103 type:complete len:140 (-) Transcript_13140:186-605(-)|eukprot:CAMPEP_0182501494 /NCGR_PEP_ID=MMETSP1321-20130603/11463_1 /TAXON_ID=91990 /ORGANISM="Bolidomonas sp., Strain RCC1657" /LENGTH=139 /DNA_ID=CAMNT_0024706179 /DNA_START=154 /DNA_END=573 /DNA_ORIENTATION=+